MTVRTDLPASSVVMNLKAGGTVPFLAINSTTFSAALTPAQLLFDYFPDDVNRNLVGSIKVTGAAQEETDVKNFFVNVDDSSVTDVQVVTSASDMRCAPHVVNLLIPAGDPSELWESLLGQEASVLTRFYEEFGDDYDFANVIYLHPDSFLNRDHFAVKNDVSGIGQPLIDQTAQVPAVRARSAELPGSRSIRSSISRNLARSTSWDINGSTFWSGRRFWPEAHRTGLRLSWLAD